MAGASSDSEETISAINVTPFVDIVLVLLVILMVTSSQIVKSAMKVDLPKAASGGDAVSTTLNVLITRQGELMLDGQTVGSAQLAARVKQAARANPKLQAVVAADQGVPYGKVVAVLDLVKGNGVKSFALNVDKSGGGP
jgi:biopolymer transport protein ExbD